MVPSKNNNTTPAPQREFTVTHVGQIAVNYKVGQKLSYPKEDTDDTIAWKVNFNCGLQTLDLGFLNKNNEGELCFGARMDGRTFETVVLKIKEAA